MLTANRCLVVLGLALLVGACSSSSTNSGANSVAAGGSAASGNGSKAGNSANAGASGSGAAGTNGGGAAGGTSSTAGAAGTTGITGAAGCGGAACGTNGCGQLVDACGATVDCGYSNCVNGSSNLCGTTVPNVCTPCTPLDVTTADCAGTVSGTGHKCGPLPDGCDGFVQCPACPVGQCCGCGGVASVCADAGSNSFGNSGLNATCIVGTQGCLCDAQTPPSCAPGLTCTARTGALPPICCAGTNCTQPTISVGASCGAPTGPATCTPGVTIPTASGTNDNCGYPATSFNESSFLCGINATGGGSSPALIQAFVNDEWPLTLGCATTTNPVSALPSDPGTVYYPQTGDPACNDTLGRPMRPSLYITDISSDPNCKAGDVQAGGKAYDPIEISGVWTHADATGTPVKDRTITKNYWTLGTGSDPIPAQVLSTCPCSAAKCPGVGNGTEVAYGAGLISGHSYRLQVVAHDGDQTQGGDSGEYCAVFCAGGGSCNPLTCADYPSSCGQQPDGCGGLTPKCGNCSNCTPKTCAGVCGGTDGTGCAETNDGIYYILSCQYPDGCSGGQIQCWCRIG